MRDATRVQLSRPGLDRCQYCDKLNCRSCRHRFVSQLSHHSVCSDDVFTVTCYPDILYLVLFGIQVDYTTLGLMPEGLLYGLNLKLRESKAPRIANPVPSSVCSVYRDRLGIMQRNQCIHGRAGLQYWGMEVVPIVIPFRGQ